MGSSPIWVVYEPGFINASTGFGNSLILICGVLAQLGEHLPYKQRVIGSSPIGPTITDNLVIKLNICADMAQLAEQLTCNQQVIGSSPIIGLKYGWVPEWPKGADCKSVSDAFEGSNPSPST